jgi:hypothetical protein
MQAQQRKTYDTINIACTPPPATPILHNPVAAATVILTLTHAILPTLTV